MTCRRRPSWASARDAAGRGSHTPAQRAVHGRLFALGERFQHPVRDVDARIPIDRVLDDQIEPLGFGDLPDHAVGPFHQPLYLLIAPDGEVLAKFPLHALELHAAARQLLLLRPAVALGHGHRVPIELALELLDLGLAALKLLLPRRELLLQLLARALGRGGFAADALDVDETDLELRRPGGTQAAKRKQQYDGPRKYMIQCALLAVYSGQPPARPRPQNIPPMVNWNCCIWSPGSLRIGLATLIFSGPIGDTHNSARPVETRSRFKSIVSPTTPESTNALSLTDRSFCRPGNGNSSSVFIC